MTSTPDYPCDDALHAIATLLIEVLYGDDRSPAATRLLEIIELRATNKQIPEPPILLTPPDVARMLRVSPDSVRTWIRSGKLKAVNLGDGLKKPRYRVTRDSLDLFLAARMIEVKPTVKRRRAPERLKFY